MVFILANVITILLISFCTAEYCSEEMHKSLVPGHRGD